MPRSGGRRVPHHLIGGGPHDTAIQPSPAQSQRARGARVPIRGCGPVRQVHRCLWPASRSTHRGVSLSPRRVGGTTATGAADWPTTAPGTGGSRTGAIQQSPRRYAGRVARIFVAPRERYRPAGSGVSPALGRCAIRRRPQSPCGRTLLPIPPWLTAVGLTRVDMCPLPVHPSQGIISPLGIVPGTRRAGQRVAHRPFPTVHFCGR